MPFSDKLNSGVLRKQDHNEGKTIFKVMVVFKIVLGLESLLMLITAALYVSGTLHYKNEQMPYALQPSNTFVPYLPVAPGDSLSDPSFTYSRASTSQLVAGGLGTLNAVIHVLLALCCLKSRLKIAGIAWTVGGTIHTIIAAIAAALTFIDKHKSDREFPNALQTSPEYWSYGNYTGESWVCGNGKALISFAQIANGNNPLGGDDAINKFKGYCTEAKAAKWISVLMVITSIIMIIIGIVTFFKARSGDKRSAAGGQQTYNAYGGAPAREAAPPMASYSSGESSGLGKPVGSAMPAYSGGAGYGYGAENSSGGEDNYAYTQPAKPTAAY